MEVWRSLYDTLLVESTEGDLHETVSELQALVQALPAQDPLRADALYWLADAYYSLGEVRLARESLHEAIRSGVNKTRSLELLGEIELETSSITTLPVRWTFDDEAHGFFHPWRFADRGSIRIGHAGAEPDPALVWTTQVDPRYGDELMVGFRHTDPAPQAIAFAIETTRVPAAIRVLTYDIHGRSYGPRSRVYRIAMGEALQIVIDLTDLVALDGTDAPFDAGAIDRFVIQDVTAYYRETGRNELVIDNFAVY